MTIVSGRVRVNRPYFYTDTKGDRAEFPAMGEGTADLDGHELARFEADVRGGMIDRIDDVEQPVTQADELDRDAIAAMGKADLLDMLDAHGWAGDKRLGVEKLRDALIGIMFVGDAG